MMVKLTSEQIVWITHFGIALYATNFWIQQNTLPFLIKKFGADSRAFGQLQTVFALLQLFGSPIFGRLGDLAGARKALILAYTSSLISYLLLAIADSITFLFISRLPIVFMHAMQGGQMVITDLSQQKERVSALGKLGVSYAVGMVVGNALGGVLAKLAGEQTAALVAASGTLINIGLVLVCVPSHLKQFSAGERKKKEKASDDEGEGATDEDPSRSSAVSEPSNKNLISSILNVKTLLHLMKSPTTRYLLSIKLITGIPIGVLQSMFPIVAVTLFKVDPMGNGFIMAYIAIISMVVQGLVLPYLSANYPDEVILRKSVVCLTVSYTLMAFVAYLWQFCAVTLPLVLGLTSLNVVVSSALTKSVTEKDTGAILGVNMAINNVIRIVSPFVGGWMLSGWGFGSFGWLGGVMSAATLAYMAFAGSDLPSRSWEEKEADL